MTEARSATAILIEEHSFVGMVMVAMERAAQRIRAGDDVDVHAVEQMVEFTRGFTDGCHHAKEERFLFPRMLEATAEAKAPVSVMLREHEAGRARIAVISAGLEEARRGDAAARVKIAEDLDGYASLLRSHIAKENHVLFPLADRALGEDEKRGLAADFEQVEQEEISAGRLQRFHALAEELARESG